MCFLYATMCKLRRVDNLQCRLSYTRTDVHIEAHTYCKLVKVILSGLLVKIVRSNQIGDADDSAGGQVRVRMELRNEQDAGDSNPANAEGNTCKPLMAKLMVSVYLAFACSHVNINVILKCKMCSHVFIVRNRTAQAGQLRITTAQDGWLQGNV